MQEVIERFQGDSTLMLIAGIALVVLLVIVLVIVVSSLRVRMYRHRFKTRLFENEKQKNHIAKLEEELATFKTTNKENKELIMTLVEKEKNLLTLKSSHDALEHEFNETQSNWKNVSKSLEEKESAYALLAKEYHTTKERLDTSTEENTKYRTTNGRLLLKLENGKQLAKK